MLLPDGFDPRVSEEAIPLINFCHENAHRAEHDIEDGLLISLSKKEVWLTVLAWLILSQTMRCLGEDCAAVTERMSELIDVQKQHWRERPPGS